MANELDEKLVSRTFDRMAEKSVLSSILQDSTNVSFVADTLDLNEFSSEIYQKIYKAILKLHNNNSEINIVTLRDELIKEGEKGDIVDMNFLKELHMFATVPSRKELESFAKIVREKYIIRKVIEECVNINKICVNGDTPTDDIIADALGKFYDLTKEKGYNEYSTIKEIIPEVLLGINEASKSEDGITGIKTGITQLDYVLSGLQKGNLIIIGARPGEGKTAFALNLAHAAMKNGEKVVFFSLEMSKKEIAARLLQMESGVNGKKFRNGRLSKDDWDKLYDASTIFNDQLIVDDTAGIKMAELRSKCKNIASEKDKKLGIIFIDYLQLMESPNKNLQRHLQIGEFSRGLKTLAKELNVPIVALAQTRRASGESDDKKDKRPKLEDLRESGSIEQDADVVLLLYRPNKDGDGNGDQRLMVVNVAKHRNGETANIKLIFDTNTLRFYLEDKGNIEPPSQG